MHACPRARGTLASSLLWTLKLLAVAAIGFEVLYLVLANVTLWVFLRPLLRWAAPEDISLEYTSATSFFPGYTTVTGLRLAGHQGPAEWIVIADRAFAHFELGELFSHHVHVTHVEAQGVTFRLRLRLQPTEADDPSARALPPVDGYPDPPILDATVPPADDISRTWSAALDDVDAELREIWIHHYRFTGAARARGGFAVLPFRSVHVAESSLTIREGEVTVAEYGVARALAGVATCRIEPFDPQSTPPAGVLAGISGALDLTAQLPGAAFLAFYSPQGDVALEDGSGAVRVAAAVQRGVLTEDSALLLETDHIVARAAGLALTASAAIEAHVERPSGLSPRLRATLRLPDARLERPKQHVAPLIAARAQLDVQTRTLDLANPGLASVVLDLPAAHVGDLRLITGLERTSELSAAVLGGSADLAAHLALDGQGRGGGLVRASAHSARVRVANGTATIGLRIAAELRGVDLLARRARVVGATVEAEPVDLTGDDGARATLSGKATIPQAELFLGESLDIQAAVRATGSDVGALFDYAGVSGPLRWAPEILGVHAFAADGTIARRGGALALDVTSLRSGAVTGSGHLRLANGRRAGGVLLRAGMLSAGISLGEGAVGVTPFPGEGWLTEQLGETPKR